MYTPYPRCLAQVPLRDLMTLGIDIAFDIRWANTKVEKYRLKNSFNEEYWLPIPYIYTLNWEY